MTPDYTNGVLCAKRIMEKAFYEADQLLLKNGLRLGDIKITTAQLTQSATGGAGDPLVVDIEVTLHATHLREKATFGGM